MQVKLHIAFDLKDGPTGGGNQFLCALRSAFRRRGAYAEGPSDANVVLFSSYHGIGAVMQLRREYPGRIFVHRVDGPMRLYNSPSDRRDSVVYRANASLADATVFQSEWSRAQNRLLGMPNNRFEAVIPNACDPLLFNRERRVAYSRDRKLRLIATSWSSNWRKGFGTYQWLDENLSFERYDMTFVGNSPVAFRNIRHVPPVAGATLGRILKEHDVYITASEKETCSNALIEALTCGLPAIALRDAGNPALVGRGGLLFDRSEEIPALIEQIAGDYECFQARICVKSVDDVLEQYASLFGHVLGEVAAGRYCPKRLTLPRRVLLCTTHAIWRASERLASERKRLSRRLC